MYIFLLIHIFMGICFYWISQNECRLFQQPAGTGQALDAPLLQWSDFEANGPMNGWPHSYRIHGTGMWLPSLKNQQPVRTWKIWKWMVEKIYSFLFGKAHSISKTIIPYSWIYNIIYIYTTDPILGPLYMFRILSLNPPKEGPNSNQNSGSFGFQVASVSKTIIPYIIPWLLY